MGHGKGFDVENHASNWMECARRTAQAVAEGIYHAFMESGEPTDPKAVAVYVNKVCMDIDYADSVEHAVRVVMKNGDSRWRKGRYGYEPSPEFMREMFRKSQ